MIVARAGELAAWRFIEFFAATIRNRNTRAAYARAVSQFFAWCERHRVRTLDAVNPIVIATYIENHEGTAPTVKQHLAAIRMLFDFLVTGQILPMNPAASVRGPRHVVRRGKTPVLKADQARQLLDSIKTDSIGGPRDRAIIGLMCYTFARVSAMVNMHAEDYYENGKRWWVRLHEKDGKVNELPRHHNLEKYLAKWLTASGLGSAPGAPLFPTRPKGKLTRRTPIPQENVYEMIRRLAVAAGIATRTSLP